MKIDGKKELIPVLYGDSAVKILHSSISGNNKLCYNAHWHERMELTFVHSGSMRITLGNEEYVIPCGSLGIIPPEKTHTAFSGENGVEYYTVMFDITSFYNSSFATEKHLKPIVNLRNDFIPITNDTEIINTVTSIIKEQLNGDEYSSLIVIGKIYILLGLLYQKCLSLQTPLELQSENFTIIFDYIANNYCDNISSAQLSVKFGYSEAYFCRRFKAITGLTPMKYINILRLEKAKSLLKNGNTKISVVSAKCGFNSVSYFSKLYKNHFGISPKEFCISNNNHAVN